MGEGEKERRRRRGGGEKGRREKGEGEGEGEGEDLALAICTRLQIHQAARELHHDVHVVPLQDDLLHQLHHLSPHDVVARLEQLVRGVEEGVVVARQVLAHEGLLPGQAGVVAVAGKQLLQAGGEEAGKVEGGG